MNYLNLKAFAILCPALRGEIGFEPQIHQGIKEHKVVAPLREVNSTFNMLRTLLEEHQSIHRFVLAMLC
jgi:hypothetical protein